MLVQTIEQARELPGEYRAGGTDIQERRRHGISGGPLVDISRLAGLAGVEWLSDGGARIGALATITAVADDPALRSAYPGLTATAGALATPQIRAVGTLGGSLLQRTRCWYYRHPAFSCFKSGGEGCPSRAGQHQYGVCFDLGPCVFPHPSSIGMALLAYDARTVIDGAGERPLTAVFGDGTDGRRDHQLAEGELLTHVVLPAPAPDERAAYFRSISRARAEWPLAECIVRLGVAGGAITWSRVAVGGVAPVPLRLPEVEAALQGRPAEQATLEAAAARATAGASPLPQTGYKLPLLERTVLETLERALAGDPSLSG